MDALEALKAILTWSNPDTPKIVDSNGFEYESDLLDYAKAYEEMEDYE